MASNGTQAGWEGAPAFPSTDAPATGPDLQELARWAVTRGNSLKGTTAQRNSHTSSGRAAEGQLWYDTTTKSGYVYTGSGWAYLYSPPENFNLSFIGPNYIPSTSSPPSGRVRNREVRLTGLARSIDGLTFTPGTNYRVFDVPSQYAPGYDVRFPVTAGPANTAALVIPPSGQAIFAVFSGWTGSLTMGLDHVQWELP